MLNLQSIFSKTIEAIQSSKRLKDMSLNLQQLKIDLVERLEKMIKNILINQASYYPQAPITGGSLRMNAAINEISRGDDEENDLIYSNGIKISKHLKTEIKQTGKWN